MAARDPNVAKLQLVARALGPLREQVVFVGGCAVGLLITDEAAAPADRGADDLLASHDLEDIVNVLDGRPSLLNEIAASPSELREYLTRRCADLLAMPLFADYLPGLIAAGDDQADRAQLVYERLRTIAG